MFKIQFKHKIHGDVVTSYKYGAKSAFTAINLMKSLGFVVIEFKQLQPII